MADKFNTFFMNKMANIWKNRMSNSPFEANNFSMNRNITFSGGMLQKFKPALVDEVKEITMKSPNKSSDLDSVPIWLLKKCIDQLFSLIMAITDEPVTESVMPSCLKCTIIMPRKGRCEKLLTYIKPSPFF